MSRSRRPTRSERPEGANRSSSRRSPAALRGNGSNSACRARSRARAVPRSSPSGHVAGFAAAAALPTSTAIGPSSCTSCSSSTPNCSRARRRASAISASASAVVAPPAFSMKFACIGEITAPPIRWPFSPHASSIRPAPSSWSGFLKTLPKVRLFVGWVALRCAISSAHGRLDLLRRPRRRAGTRPRRRPRRARRSEERYASPRPCGVIQASPSDVNDVGADEDLRPVAAVGARVHPDAAAGRAGDRARELEAAEAGRARVVEADGVRRAAAGDQQLALDAHRGEVAGQPEHERVDALVGREQVRAEPDRRDRELALGRPRERPLELVERRRPRERPRRAAGPDRRQPRERDAFLERSPRAPPARAGRRARRRPRRP